MYLKKEVYELIVIILIVKSEVRSNSYNFYGFTKLEIVYMYKWSLKTRLE